MLEEKRYRITIDVDKNTYRKIGILIPHGLRNALFAEIFHELIPILERGGPRMVAMILTKHIKPSSVLEIFEEEREDEPR